MFWLIWESVIGLLRERGVARVNGIPFLQSQTEYPTQSESVKWTRYDLCPSSSIFLRIETKGIKLSTLHISSSTILKEKLNLYEKNIPWILAFDLVWKSKVYIIQFYLFIACLLRHSCVAKLSRQPLLLRPIISGCSHQAQGICWDITGILWR